MISAFLHEIGLMFLFLQWAILFTVVRIFRNFSHRFSLLVPKTPEVGRNTYVFAGLCCDDIIPNRQYVFNQYSCRKLSSDAPSHTSVFPYFFSLFWVVNWHHLTYLFVPNAMNVIYISSVYYVICISHVINVIFLLFSRGPHELNGQSLIYDDFPTQIISCFCKLPSIFNKMMPQFVAIHKRNKLSHASASLLQFSIK